MTVPQEVALARHAGDLDDDGHDATRMVNPMTTAGDLIVGGVSGVAARLGKGADGFVLTVDPTTHLLIWAAAAGGAPSGAAGGGLSGTYPNPSVVDDSHAHTAGTLPGLAPTGADYLVGTAQGGLSAEIVVGATPGGELGGTWASPTVDGTHAGSAHHAESHAARHAAAGADSIKLDDLAAPDDNTDLNVSTSAHGLMSKLPGGSTNYLREDGTWASPPGGSSGVTVADEGTPLATTGTTLDFVGAGVAASGAGATKTITIPGGALTDHTHAATGSGATGGGATLNPVTMKLPAAMGTTEGQVDWDATQKAVEAYDTQRERAVSDVGWCPFAMPLSFNAALALTSSSTLAANGGTIVVPVYITGHMLLQAVYLRSNDTTLARTWGWDLYVQRLNNGNAGENALDRVATGAANETFTAAAASTRIIAASGAPVYLGPGLYWLAIQNRHATNNFAVGATAASAVAATLFASNQAKTTTNPNGATLDFVAATWVKSSGIAGVALQGRVFGQATAWGV